MSSPAPDTGAASPIRRDIAGLLVLTAATGALDAVSYLGLDRVFTGNMTGNVLFISMGLAGDTNISLLNNLVALLAFLAGAVCATRTVSAHTVGGRLSRRAIGVLIANTILVAATGVYWCVSGALTDPMMLIITVVLSALLGAQAAIVTRLGSRDLSTVVLTSVLVRLAASSHLAGGDGHSWRARLLAVASMSAGAVISGVLTLQIGGWLGLVPAVLFLAAGAILLSGSRRLRASSE